MSANRCGRDKRMESSPGQSRGWNAVSALFAPTMAWSVLVVLVSEGLQRLLPMQSHLPSLATGAGEGRILYFFGISYLTLIPILTLRIRGLVEHEQVPDSTLTA